MSAVLLDAGAIKRTLGRMSHEVLEANGGADDLVVLGVLRRGYPVAKRLAWQMTEIEGVTVPCGKLDIRPFRDDSVYSGADESEVPFEVTGKTVLLVDEVIFTGRTIRAAIDATFRFGRPRKVILACLVDRGHRELPIQPDFVGKTVPTTKEDHIVVKLHELDGEDLVVWEEGAR